MKEELHDAFVIICKIKQVVIGRAGQCACPGAEGWSRWTVLALSSETKRVRDPGVPIQMDTNTDLLAPSPPVPPSSIPDPVEPDTHLNMGEDGDGMDPPDAPEDLDSGRPMQT